MKGKRILLGIMMVAALLILARPAISNADTYGGAWLPNDSDVFVIELTLNTGTDSFSMYDWGDTTANLQLITDGVFDSDTVYFTQDVDDDWWASFSESTQTLSLGSSPEFGFYFSGTTNYLSYDLKLIELCESYTLFESNTGMTVAVSDAAPVPIPETALFLTSGLFALVAIRRVRQ